MPAAMHNAEMLMSLLRVLLLICEVNMPVMPTVVIALWL